MRTGRIISIMAFLVYLATVAFLCFANFEDMPQQSPTWFGLPADKIAHMLMFLPFPPLAYMVFEPRRDMTLWKALLIITIILMGIGLAFFTEEIQSRLTYRTYDIKDILADLIGLSAGTFITVVYMFIRK